MGYSVPIVVAIPAMACFMVIGREEPLYELLLEPTLSRREDVARATQFVLHGSLDLVDLQVWTNPVTYVSQWRALSRPEVPYPFLPLSAPIQLLQAS